MLVMGYDWNLEVALLCHITVTLGEVMDYRKQRRRQNSFIYHAVRLNLPSGVNYKPFESWVSKIRKYGNVLSEVFIYVDNVWSLVWFNK